MTLRQVPGSVALGLISALLAHAALFGGDHAMGGAYHSLLLQFGTAAMLGAAAASGVLLWSGARFAADGTVLSARMSGILPSFPALAIASLGWFALAESIESAHTGAPAVTSLLAVALAAWLVLRLALIALRLLAGAAFEIARPILVRHAEPVQARHILRTPLRQALRDEIWSRRFSRPPPVTANA